MTPLSRRLTPIVVATVVLTVAALIGASTASANGVPFKRGDVLADVGGGIIKHFNAKGELLDELNTTTGTREGDGMCFDAAGNLFATQGFVANMVSKFDSGGNLLEASFGSGYNEHPESCVVSAAQDIYVGQPDGSKEVLEFNTKGEPLASFAPEPTFRGTDWLDLASDQCTLEYTSEGSALKAYNVCTKTQLPNVTEGLPAPCYAHRILADGSHLVACASAVEHVNSSGVIINTYEPEPGEYLFALNLDPDGETFWTANYFNGNVYRINIASGAVVTTFSAAPLNSVLGGLAVVGEVTCSEAQLKLSPASAENEVGRTHTVTATATECGKPVSGATVTFKVTGANPQTGTGTTNAAGEATFTYKGEHAGTDHIVASFVNKKGETETSNEVTKKWTEPEVVCPAKPPKVNVRWHYSAEGSAGSWSVTREAKCGQTLTMGPQAMEGALKVTPGKKIKAGYDFTLPSNNKPFTVMFTEGKVVFKVKCVSGAKPSEPTFTVTLPNQSYSVTNANWYPSGNQSSPLVYQGEREVPALCGKGQLSLAEGGTFSSFFTIH
jgi:hypothetical protein